jgi:hypothetical protein
LQPEKEIGFLREKLAPAPPGLCLLAPMEFRAGKASRGNPSSLFAFVQLGVSFVVVEDFVDEASSLDDVLRHSGGAVL